MKKKFNLSNAKIRIIAIALSVVAALSAVGVIAGVNTGFFGGKSNPTSSTTSVEKKMADAERKIKQVQAQAAADKKAAEKQSQEQAAKEKEKKDELDRLRDELKDEQDKRAENEKKIESLEKLLDELKEELKDNGTMVLNVQNSGITDPRLHITLPYRVHASTVPARS